MMKSILMTESILQNPISMFAMQHHAVEGSLVIGTKLSLQLELMFIRWMAIRKKTFRFLLLRMMDIGSRHIPQVTITSDSLHL